MSVAGKWNVTMDTPLGTLRCTWEFANDAGVWRGKMIGQGPVGDAELQSVRVDGGALTFQTTTRTPMGSIDLTVVGTASSDSLQGTCKTRFGDTPFSASRA
jgi:hypothetical protein